MKNIKYKGDKLEEEYPGDGVTLSAIYTRDVVKKRKCLMCGKMFKSKGRFNRRCGRCDRLIDIRHKNSFYQQSEYKVSYPQGDDTSDMADWFNLDLNE